MEAGAGTLIAVVEVPPLVTSVPALTNVIWPGLGVGVGVDPNGVGVGVRLAVGVAVGVRVVVEDEFGVGVEVGVGVGPPALLIVTVAPLKEYVSLSENANATRPSTCVPLESVVVSSWLVVE